MIQLRKEMQHGQTKQVCPGEGVEELHVPGFVKAEEEYAASAKPNAGQEEEIIHKEPAANCK